MFRLNEFRRVFEENIPLKPIASELFCLKADMDARDAKGTFNKKSFDAVGISEDGNLPALGHVLKEDLNTGTCRDYLRNFKPEDLMCASTPLIRIFELLRDRDFVFVMEGNKVSYIVTRADLQKLIVRAYVVGLILLLEDNLTNAIKTKFEEKNYYMLLRKVFPEDTYKEIIDLYHS